MLAPIIRLACVFGLAFASPALAAPPGASDWSSGLHASMRLIDGGPGGEPAVRKAAIEIRLDPHFKTYWRSPGDSGLPPAFDWSGSDNVRAVEVLWPAPTRFTDPSGTTLGYKEQAALPLRATLADPARPATLRLKLDYAVCEKICIPVKGEATLPLGGALAPFADAVAAAQRRVPAPAAVGAPGAPAIARAEAAPGGDALVVAVRTAPGAPTDLFAEGPSDEWLFGAPQLVGEETRDGARTATFRVPLENRPAGAALAGQVVTLTLTAGDAAIEARAPLDATVKPH